MDTRNLGTVFSFVSCVPSLNLHRRSTPDFARGFDHQLELPPLVVDGQRVAHEVAGEPALRAETQLLERQHLRRFVDAALQPSRDSSAGVFDETRPRITWLPFGTWRSGSKSPARSLSYSMKKFLMPTFRNTTSLTYS